ncbi:MAG TPA: type II toxin-antitoxin system death-on-curing family toxin [Rhabdochlamydiaceae bacterium]|nr:type II toxin-antitoxin system death-on-curing family toxin [Rhabdochlamydiaceae bacterium]
MIFITVQEIIDDHAEIIRMYGGVDGIRDIGLLISAIEMPKARMFGEFLHPTVFDKAAAYLFHIICNHPFVDGNKRTGMVTALTFLRQNQIHIKFTKEQIAILEELVVSTAASKITKEQIANFFKECYTGPELFDNMAKPVLDVEEQK